MTAEKIHTEWGRAASKHHYPCLPLAAFCSKLLPSEWLRKVFVRGGGREGKRETDSLKEEEARHMRKAWKNFLLEKNRKAHTASCPRPVKPGKERRTDSSWGKAGLQQGDGSSQGAPFPGPDTSESSLW